MRKINQKREKALRNEEFADKFKDFSSNNKDKKKKLRAERVKKRDELWWEHYYS